MNRLKLIIICLLNANVNYMQQVHHYGSSRNRIWPSDEKRQDLKVNNYNTHDERLLIFCLFFDFFCLSAVANFCCKLRFHVLLSVNRSVGILTHNSKRSFLKIGGPYCKTRSKQNMSGITVENIVALFRLSQTQNFVLIDTGSSLFDFHVHIHVCIFIK